VSTRELVAFLGSLGVVIAISYAFAIEPKTWTGFLLVIPMLVVAVVVVWLLERRQERS
jgi:hypothetical protein